MIDQEHRARVSKVLSLCLLCLALVMLTSAQGSAAESIVVSNPGGVMEKALTEAYFKPFEAETGIKILSNANPSQSLGILKVQVDSKNIEWDLFMMEFATLFAAEKQGLLEPIDYSKVDTSQLRKEAVHPYFLGHHTFSTVMAYNTQKYTGDNCPKTWADFWDVKKFPGRRSLSKAWLDTLEWALLADGVPMDKLYPLDVDRAFKSLDKIKPHIHVWWDRGAQAAQLMVDKEVDLIATWNGRAQAAIDQGAPFKINWNQGLYDIEGCCVLKGCKKKDLAFKFLNWINTHPERDPVFSQYVAYGPCNLNAYKFIPEERKNVLAGNPELVKNMFQLDFKWRADNYEKMTERWSKWLVQ